jgi:protein-disulfide isomerase
MKQQHQQQAVRRRNTRHSRRRSTYGARRWLSRHWLEVALASGVVVILAMVITGRAPWDAGANAGAANARPAAGTGLSATAADAGNSLGSPTAPVTIINYSDFMCPYCTVLANQIEPQLIRDYVNTGKVRYIVREGAFLTPDSQVAAEAADCAEDQGAFWPYHNLLYAQRAQASSGIYTTDKLKGYAAQLGLNMPRFSACLDSQVHAGDVQRVTDGATALSVNGTPTVFINGRPLVGGQPYSAYQQAIDAALGQK